MKNLDPITSDVLIVGAGVAGSSLAIRLADTGLHVLVVEKYKFPRHKLCGEFVSPECLSHFESLGVMESMAEVGGDVITETRFYSEKGRSVAVPSKWFSGGETGALGISRSEMDYRLLNRAREGGAEVIDNCRVTSVSVANNKICGVLTKDGNGNTRLVEAGVIVDATGRSRILGKLVEKRAKKVKKRIRHIAFKAHFENVRLQKGVCEIYFFRGGYGGLNHVEDGAANHCFIVDSKVGREFKGDADRIVEEVIFRNPRVKQALKDANRRFEWIAVSIDKFGLQHKNDIENLVSIGDAGAFIDPFTGSGMLMALESGDLLAKTISRLGIEDTRKLKDEFEFLYGNATRTRLRLCRLLRGLAFAPFLAHWVIVLAGLSEGFVERLATLTRPVHEK